jgi:hypothetical protein
VDDDVEVAADDQAEQQGVEVDQGTGRHDQRIVAAETGGPAVLPL